MNADVVGRFADWHTGLMNPSICKRVRERAAIQSDSRSVREPIISLHVILKKNLIDSITMTKRFGLIRMQCSVA